MTLLKRLESLKKNFLNKGTPYIYFLIKKNLFRLDIYFVYPFALICCLFIFILRPLIFIRFGCLNSEKIGNFSALPELYLCEKEHNFQSRKSFDIFAISRTNFVCNHQLLKMWKRKLRVWKNSIYFFNIMRNIKFLNKHVIKTTNDSRDIHGLLKITKPHLTFTEEEIKKGEEELKNLGLNNKKFILMINRGQNYLDNIYDFKINFEYHSYRNSPITDYIPAAEKLTKKGYFVLRVGHLVPDKIKTNNEKIIDYDNNGYRTEFLDMYLAYKCEYIFGTDTGYFGIPGWNFRKPTLYVNFSQFEHMNPWLPSWIVIFKKYWIIEEKRFMKFKEIIRTGVGRSNKTEDFKKAGIELILNTKDEIIDANLEMEQRVSGLWVNSEENKYLQSLFWRNFEKSDLHGNFSGNVGSKFLRDNKDLL